jgi:class 3 adenylate cyclase
MSPPLTRYAPSGDAQIAYRTAGAGPAVILLSGTISGIALWEQRLGAPFVDAIARFARVVVYDARGAGRSDPLPPGAPATVAGQVDDAIAVLDDASIDQAVIVGFHAGGAAALALAAAHPDRVANVLIVNSWARLLEDDGYPGITQEFSDDLVDEHRRRYGTDMFSELFAPSVADDPAVSEFFAGLEQHGSSRSQAVLLTRMAQELDVRDILSTVAVPTVVMHSDRNTAVPAHFGRYIAEHVPDATFVTFPGTDHAFLLANPGPALAELETIVTGRRPDPETDRILATVLFTDIVGSTERAAGLGDRGWGDLLARHHEVVRDELDRCRGREIDTAGDGFFAVFDAPARAIRCAQSIGARLDALGLEIRAGIHTGECEQIGDNLGGIAVHIGARIAAMAGPGEILVSSTVKDLTVGSRVELVDRGTHTLKGVPEPWRIYAVEDPPKE